MPGNLVTIVDADGEIATVTGGKLDVNATVSAGGDGAIQDGANSAIEATVFDFTNSNPLAVVLRDTNGDYVSVGGGTQYTEDAAAVADPVGTALNLVRQDTPATLVSLNGDNVAARGTNYGALYTQVVTSAGAFVDTFGGGTQYTEGDVDATITGTVMMMEGAADTLVAAQGTAANGLEVDVTRVAGTVTVDGSAVTQPVSAASLPLPTGAATSAAQLPDGHNVTVDNAAGASAVNIQDGGNSITIDGSVSVTGAVDTELTTADLDTGAGTDTRAVVGLVGSASGGGALIPGSATDGLLVNLGANNDVTVAGVATAANQLPDGHNVTVDNAAGASAVNIQDGGNSITVDGSLTVDLGVNNDVTVTSGTIDVIGTVADDAISPGDPVMVGGQAVSPDGTDPTSVAEGDAARLRVDLNRRLYVATNHPRTWHYHLNTSTAQTDTSVQAAPGAGLRLVITNIQFTSGAATAINMFLEEGVTTIWGPVYLEAVAGRGYVSGPIFKPITANTALTLTTSAAIAHAVEILGFIEAV